MSSTKAYASVLSDLFSLEGKVALITGAAGSIGSTLAYGLSFAGASVALADISTAPFETMVPTLIEAGRTACSYYVDLGRQETIEELVADVVAELGQVDILLNVAAINRREPILDVTQETYDRIMNVNLRGLFQLSQAAARQMRGRRCGGKIVNIGSINSEMGLDRVSVYGATKGGVKQLTKAMAVEWAPYNIQVNCIIPGFMRTPLSAPVWADPVRRAWMTSRIAMRRPGEPDELLGMAIFLSSKASSYVTGQSMIIDGGVLAGGSSWDNVVIKEA